MKKLCVFTLYADKGASSKYRAFLFKEELNANFDVKWFYFWNNDYVVKYMHKKKKYAIRIFFLYIVAVIKRLFQLIFLAPKADVCFFQKTCIPKCFFNNFEYLKKRGIRIVFDVDDAVYTSRKDYSEKLASLSDVVLCGNENLCNHYKKYNSNVVFFPTIEKTSLFKPFWKETFRNKTIGWIGSLSTIDNLDLLVQPINRLVIKYPEINFLIVSNSALDYTDRIKNSRFVQWNEHTYIADLSTISVGVMPLKNNEFNRGKCGFKLIQYLNMKKPVVASDVGTNSTIVGNCGYLAYSEKDWFELLERLLFSENDYNEKKSCIENEFFEKYGYEDHVKHLLQLLKSA